MSAEVLLVAGARPNFVKIAPLSAALRRDGRLRGTVVHTGQHYDREMSQVFFEQLGVPEPGIRLHVGSGTHARQTAEIMLRIEPVLLERRPAAVVVVGDVNSTVAASLVSVKLGIPVAHVEAGLRSFDRSMPEEINRIVTDSVSEWLFVSERSGLENLAREGADPRRIHFAGNVMIDTLEACRARAEALRVPERMGLGGEYAVLTLHRPSNVDDPDTLGARLQPILGLAERMPVVFPVHPRTRHVLAGIGAGERPGLRLVEPMGYLEFLGLMGGARIVLTDSGGVQEETTVLGIPCVTLRENTERPVTVAHGTNRLAGVEPEGVRQAIAQALDSSRAPRMPELWDGKAAERIVAALARDLEG
jgi:UDP-N-acetylglucosamine 2-epimerase (non-hydrolysing)